MSYATDEIQTKRKAQGLSHQYFRPVVLLTRSTQSLLMMLLSTLQHFRETK